MSVSLHAPSPAASDTNNDVTRAVVFEEPEKLSLRWLPLPRPGPGQVVVDVDWSAISTGTERLLWTGRMPAFPGMGYPLVPGYETVGTIAAVGPGVERPLGEPVFVSGARCFGEVHGLFGGAASRLVVDSAKATAVPHGLGEQATLLALAATAYHALRAGADEARAPELIVGHGVLGRLIARIALACGFDAPRVWETDAGRRRGHADYPVLDPADDDRRDYATAIDVSGDPAVVDAIVARLARRGRVVLAGFYAEPVAFAFPPAFMREISIDVAAEWEPRDLTAVLALIERGRLNLDRLISHRAMASAAPQAYRTAFSDSRCLKMVLDWRHHA